MNGYVGRDMGSCRHKVEWGRGVFSSFPVLVSSCMDADCGIKMLFSSLVSIALD